MTTTTTTTLTAIAIIERDVHGDTLLSWQYPSLGVLRVALEAVVMRRCPLTANTQHTTTTTTTFTFSKFHEYWIYSQSTMGAGDERLVASDDKVTAYGIVVIAQDFHPEKYAAMLRLFAHMYSSTSTAATPSKDVDNHIVTMLQEYLSIFAVDRSTRNAPSAVAFHARDHDPRRAMVKVPLQLLLDTLGLENLLSLWTAMMLKKRILVVGDHIGLLQQVVRCIPTLVWHRLPAVFDTLRPLVDFSHAPELEDLAQMSTFVAGSLDIGAKSDTRRYDLLVDLTAQQVVVPDGTLREDIKITRLHKTIAQTIEEFRTQGAQLVKQLALKTREILLQLEQLRDSDESTDEAMLTMEHLRSLSQPRDVERLLFNIGVCENIARVQG